MTDKFTLTEFGKELVEAMPDRKAVAAVKRRWRRRLKPSPPRKASK